MDVKRTGPKAPSPSSSSTFEARLRGSRVSANCPHAVFTTVPASKQAQVTTALKRSLTSTLEGHVAPGRQAAVDELLTHVGQPDFYDVLARHDPKHAGDWKDMAKVQRQFAAAEPRYDPKTRAYSESMRLTLHAAVLQHFADPGTNKGMTLYDRFIALHPTAFHQNGGWVDNLQIPLSGAMAVAQATPLEMWLHVGGLAEGSFIDDAPTVKAAQLVRDARTHALSSWSK
jgi:hypothetical protein